MRKKKIYCPANGWDCPYYKKGECGIEDPIKECDDFSYFWDADDDYICEDEERMAFENDKKRNGVEMRRFLFFIFQTNIV